MSFLINPYRFSGGGGGAASYTLVGSAAGGNTTTLPTVASGDLIITGSFNDGGVALASVTGYTIVLDANRSVNRAAMFFKISDGTETTFDPGEAGIERTAVVVLRPSGGTPALGASTSHSANDASPSFATITLDDTSGPSWVIGMACFANGGTGITVAGMTVTDNSQINGNDATLVAHTNGGVTSFAAETISSVNGSGNWVAITAEFKLT